MLEGKRVSQEQLVFLTPNFTTKEEVIKHLGKPSVIWEEAQIFSYDWVMRQGVLVWAVGGNYSAIGGIEDIPKAYSLIIQFDENGQVKRYQKAVRSPMQSYGEFLREWVRESDKKAP